MIFIEVVFILWYATVGLATMRLALRPSTQHATLESNLAYYQWIQGTPLRIFGNLAWIIGIVVVGKLYAELPVAEVYLFNLAVQTAVVMTAIQRGIRATSR